MQQAHKLSNQSKEKDIECNLRLKISTEREETMASGKEFQVLIRFEKTFPSRTDTIRDLNSLAQCPRVTALRLVKKCISINTDMTIEHLITHN